MPHVRNHVRYAPVAPLPILKALWEAERNEPDAKYMLHGGYHLLLAHDVLKNEESRKAYYDHFGDVKYHYGQDTLIIMDNSIVELGDSVPLSVVAEAAKYAHADLIVLPDVMGKGIETVDKYLSIRPQLDQIPLEFMAVPQGPSMHEFAYCLEMYKTNPKITWIGIPRIATGQLGSRKDLIDLCYLINPNWSLHLLGFSDNVVDDMLCATYSRQVEGIDSAVPVRAGQRAQPFTLSRSDYGKRGDYWENPGSLADQTKINIRQVRSFIGEK